MITARLYGNEPYRAAVIHGGPGAPGSVAAIARALSDTIGVIEPIQTKLTIEGLLEELHETMKIYCHGPVLLIGHSWGAWLAFIYAARHPEFVNKLILVGSGPFEEEYAKDIDRTRMEHLSKEQAGEYTDILRELQVPPESPSERNALFGALGRFVQLTDNYCPIEISTDEGDRLPMDGPQYGAIWVEASAQRRSGALLALADTITCPVVAIHGDYDPHPADGVKKALEGKIADFSFFLLEQCGHSPWKEKYAAERFYGILKEQIEL